MRCDNDSLTIHSLVFNNKSQQIENLGKCLSVVKLNDDDAHSFWHMHFAVSDT